MSAHTDDLVDEYLRRLDAELRDLPRARRRELVQEISEHIAEARSALATEGEADVRNVIDRLGEPADIAAEARERLGVHPRKAGWMEVAALVLLPIGGVVIPILGWVVGVVLLWASEAWTVRDKLIGTLIIPGGLLLPVYLGLAGTSSSSCSRAFDAAGHVTRQTCSGGSSLPSWLVAIALGALLLAPLVTAAYLGRRMRGPSVATAVTTGPAAA
jgi:uncharacterized membrane protein